MRIYSYRRKEGAPDLKPLELKEVHQTNMRGILKMDKGIGLRPFILILACLSGLLFSCGDSDGSKNNIPVINSEPQAIIKYSGELKKGFPIGFRGSDSNLAEYFKWSYKEASQADGDYLVLDTDSSSVPLCFIKASDYDVKLEIKDGVESVVTLTIEENVIGDQYNRISFHNNGDGTYSTTLSFNDATSDIINDSTNNYIFFDFVSFDSRYNSLNGYNYYQYLLQGEVTLPDGTKFIAPCFMKYSNPEYKTILENTAPGAIDDVLMDANFLFTKATLQKAYNHNMLIMHEDGEGYVHMAYIDIVSYLALTDDTVADFCILDK